MSKSLADLVLETFEGVDLPQEITEHFNILECLGQNDLGDTWLLSEKDGDKRFILKSFRHAKLTYSEADILKGLSHKGLPIFEPKIIHGQTVFTLREYVKGIPLDVYLAGQQPLDESVAVHILTELCDIIGYLHTQPTPIIHRDIKPSNVIINPDDQSITLIDFGISRMYNENTDSDTTVFATLEFAPPEQFGFAQTDARTDIYALGVLFRYMLTGTTRRDVFIKNKAISHIIQKATALDPKERFQNVAAFKRTFKKHKLHASTSYKIFCTMAAVLIVGIVFAGGYIRFRQAAPAPEIELPQYVGGPSIKLPLAPAGTNPEIYEFAEPLIEAVVRFVLDKDENDPITYGALEAVTDIRIHGTFFTDTYWVGNEDLLQYGNIQSLEDFSVMPNLQILNLESQPFADLSPLVDNPRLFGIYLSRTNVYDLTPLTKLPHLEQLLIHHCPVTDWSALEQMENLPFLFLQRQDNINSVSDIGDVSTLHTLHITHSDAFVSLEGIQNMPWLVSLHIHYTGVKDFSLLNNKDALPYLERLVISRDMQPYLYTLERDDIAVMVE
ncbi:MAG: serine/threonine protein kinase [Defluviitaleaceae bacterium]|nr:serine/threonine protein kinase [Defluviitaleaceae bacterium]